MAAVPEKVAATSLSGCDLVRHEVAKYSGWDVNTMTAIAMAESGCRPTNHNLTSSETHSTCVGSYGALQVGCIHYRAGEDVDDLVTNVRVAHRAYLERVAMVGNGYTAWTMYTNGEYRKYL